MQGVGVLACNCRGSRVLAADAEAHDEAVEEHLVPDAPVGHGLRRGLEDVAHDRQQRRHEEGRAAAELVAQDAEDDLPRQRADDGHHRHVRLHAGQQLPVVAVLFHHDHHCGWVVVVVGGGLSVDGLVGWLVGWLVGLMRLTKGQNKTHRG